MLTHNPGVMTNCEYVAGMNPIRYNNTLRTHKHLVTSVLL